MLTESDRREAAEITAAKQQVDEVADELTQRRRRFVLAAREREEPALLSELAEVLGLHESRVQRIEEAARRERDKGRL